MSARNKSRGSGRWILILLILLCLCALGFEGIFIYDMETVKYTNVLTVESGDKFPAAEDFLLDGEDAEKAVISYAKDVSAIQTNTPGNYSAELQFRDKKIPVSILVRDTVAPEGSVRELTLINPQTVAPEDFLESYSDQTEVTVRFASSPDLQVSGSQNVRVILRDQGDNETRLETSLNVISDSTSPVIEGAKNIETYVEDTVAYRSGITVTDDQDPAPKLEIDNSAVDLSTPGDYTLTYSATDHAGNQTSVSVNVKVYPKKANHVDPETIYAAADKLLAKFIREDMTTRDKVEAVYCWVQMHTQYDSHSEKDDWLQEAYSFLMDRRGDCYSYFALNKLLLHRLGIPTIDVEKVKNYEGDTRHYWLLVSIDDGETYYHMDNVWSMALCLVTDEHLNEFSAKHDNCFNRDESLYPATPEEKLPYSPLPWNDPVIRGATR